MKTMFLITGNYPPENETGDYLWFEGVVESEKRADEIINEIRKLPDQDSTVIYAVDEVKVLT